ncbi:MAG TPA: hypothetical protein VFU88_19925 [Ktedonobacterales bacterium]|nr:hypothetical protein [Ktedonobacterales bacterium]
MWSIPALRKRADRRHGRRRAKQMTALLRAVLESPGATDPTMRQAVFHGTSPDGPLGEYVAKIRQQSYRIGDDDVQRVLESGYGQDAVFELTVAAALGTAAERCEAGMRAMRDGQVGREGR